jgi:hypothetical protein
VIDFCAYIKLCTHSPKDSYRRITVNIYDVKPDSPCLHALLFGTEDGGSTFMRNVNKVYQTKQRHTPEVTAQDNLNSHKISIPYADCSFHLRSSQEGHAGMGDDVKWKL